MRAESRVQLHDIFIDRPQGAELHVLRVGVIGKGKRVIAFEPAAADMATLGASVAKLQQLALWLKHEHPQAAASVLEGIEELFTVNALGLSPSLMRCLTSTMRSRTRTVDSAPSLATSPAGAVQGYHNLWILRQAMDWPLNEKCIDLQQEVA